MMRGKNKPNKPNLMEPEYVDPAGAETLSGGRSKWTWRRDAYKGVVSSTKVGRRLFIPVSEVRRVMAEGLRPRLQEK